MQPIIKNARNEGVTVIIPENGVNKIKSNDQTCLFTYRKDAMTWHRKHSKQYTSDNDPTNENTIKNCVVCSKGKSSRKLFQPSYTKKRGS